MDKTAKKLIMEANNGKNYLLTDDGRIQVWANYTNSVVWVTRNGELVNKTDHCTMQDVENVLHDAGF
ncbi:MAG TPA: hypothetical protein PKW49_03470 [Paludibacteraceae bacterium]|nr:hypothetical protein [Paludibacteraceae bacterium]